MRTAYLLRLFAILATLPPAPSGFWRIANAADLPPPENTWSMSQDPDAGADEFYRPRPKWYVSSSVDTANYPATSGLMTFRLHGSREWTPHLSWLRSGLSIGVGQNFNDTWNLPARAEFNLFFGGHLFWGLSAEAGARFSKHADDYGYLGAATQFGLQYASIFIVYEIAGIRPISGPGSVTHSGLIDPLRIRLGIWLARFD